MDIYACLQSCGSSLVSQLRKRRDSLRRRAQWASVHTRAGAQLLQRGAWQPSSHQQCASLEVAVCMPTSRNSHVCRGGVLGGTFGVSVNF